MPTAPDMVTLAQALAEFNAAFDQYVSPTPTVNIPAHVIALRVRLLTEEFKELIDAIAEGDLAHIAKESGDLAYVLRGTSDAFGYDLDHAISLVHASNMSKLGPDGRPLRDPQGKAMKGPGYFEPDMTPVITASVSRAGGPADAVAGSW